MATILVGKIDVTKIPKDRIYEGKKGKYVEMKISINDELGQYGDQGMITINPTQEERENKVNTPILGNVNVVWTDGTIKKLSQEESQPQKATVEAEDDDQLPF